MWNYHRDEIDNVVDDAANGKLFRYNTKIIEKTEARLPHSPQPPPNLDGYQIPEPPQSLQPPVLTLNTEVVIQLKYLSNFWKSLDLTLINCVIELDFSWSTGCVLSEDDDNLSCVSFQINTTKPFFLVVTLSINDNITFLDRLKQEFRRTVSWNKYKSEITTQPKNNNLDHMIDETFRNIDGLFVLLFKNDDKSL